eukprot:m.228606 g.228606  ORF g.228606 m.228606 type:complete len:784 (+) comp33542_c0_seq1:89-2440(+)
MLAFSFFSAMAVASTAAASVKPNYHGCDTPLAKSFQYCNTSLTNTQRVDSLIELLTLEEKIGLVAPDPGMGSTCFAHIHAIDRVGLPQYGWLVEVNTGVASRCIGPGQCVTTFSGPTGLGASFNRKLWSDKGDVLSTEMRALSNINGQRGSSSQEFIGTSAFGPNLNMIRDPRYGRNSELPGEDPFLTGSLGTAMVTAMQTADANGHPRVNAYLKHFDAYSTETNRMHSDYNISQFDFWDSYLPQYQMVFTKGKAAGAMCSYAAENGHPSCTNSWLLNDVLRTKWQRPDAYITTDCGAVVNTMGPPLNLATKEEAAAAIINGGTDLEMGTSIFNSSMLSAVTQGLVTEATITTAATRGLMQRMNQGDFDPIVSADEKGDPNKTNMWTSIGKDVINSTAHQAIAYDSALQSMVLLKNDKQVLPMKIGANVAVVGWAVNAQKSLVGPYFGDEICYAPWETRDNYTYDCIPTIGAQIAAANVGGTTTLEAGVEVSGNNATGIAAALAAARQADVVVLTLGIDHSVEHEARDVINSSLPGLQETFALQVLALNKPTVVVLVGNDCTGIDHIIDKSTAIVRVFYPATWGSKALASLLFGKENRWGKLPVTMYPEDYVDQLPLMGQHTGTAYAMAHGPGRSYRYYTGEPLFKFGQGLSLTTFSFTCTKTTTTTTTIGVTCVVKNTGDVVGDEVLQVYHSVGDEIRTKASKLHPVPFKQLVEFDRVIDLSPSKSSSVSFSLDVADALSLTTADGSRTVYAGEHQLIFSTGVPAVPDVVITVSAPSEMHIA